MFADIMKAGLVAMLAVVVLYGTTEIKIDGIDQ